MDKKFAPEKLAILNNPDRLKDIPPELLASRLGNKSPKTIVDIGAGTGLFCRAFLTVFNPDTIYACDMSDTMLNWMLDNVVPDHPRIRLVKNLESSIPLDADIADIVFMMNLHHELDSPAAMLREAQRLLKPGGEIAIADWKRMPSDQGPPLEIRCSPENVVSQLEEAGFGNIRIYNEMDKHFLLVGVKGQ